MIVTGENKLTSGKLSLVPNKRLYWDYILQLRNDPTLKQGFVSQNHIETNSHYSYMEKYGNCYRICLLNHEPVGFVGSVGGDIRVATDPRHHGKGIAKFMIQEIIKEYPNSAAKIKINNHASIRAFEKAGFVKKYYLLEPQ